MRIYRAILVLLLLTPAIAAPVTAQPGNLLEIKGRQVGNKGKELRRKRFYLFRGGLETNKALVDRIKSTPAVSRDCFFCTNKASKEYLAWLRAEDCESPYCRPITADDAKKVPEFSAAYQKGLKQFQNKQPVALQWLTINLAQPLRDGFYLQQKRTIDTILGDTKPIQSSMTDSVGIQASFIDIVLSPGTTKATETFLISNLIPIEIGGKGYVWACEVEIGLNKKTSFVLKLTGTKKCEVIAKDIPSCSGETCATK